MAGRPPVSEELLGRIMVLVALAVAILETAAFRAGIRWG
jgi:hypothetical protein